MWWALHISLFAFITLSSNAEFHPCNPSIWPRFFVSNRHRYGHRRAAMLRPLRTHNLTLDLCNATLSGQLAWAWALEPEVMMVHCTYLSVRCQWVLYKLVCNLYKFDNYTAWRKWRLGKKSQDPVPKVVAYSLTWSSAMWVTNMAMILCLRLL